MTPGYLYHGCGLEVRKNTEAVLNAYAALCKENGGEKKIPPLVISGRIYAASNPLATPVVSLIETLGLVDQVKLLGRGTRRRFASFVSGGEDVSFSMTL